MSKLSDEMLTGLRSKMPRGYIKKVQEAYLELNGKEISGRAVQAFMGGASYTAEMHSAVVNVAEMQQSLIDRTKTVTQ